MSTLVVVENVSLDGVMQSPGRPDEDARSGFDHGGWAATALAADLTFLNLALKELGG